MPIKTHVRHIIAVEVAIELPETCPHCHTLFGHGTENLVEWTLDSVGSAADVIDGKICQPSHVEDDESDENFVIAYSCKECKTTIYGRHQRTWILDAMPLALAAKLGTLLYDSNVVDESIRKKVFGV